MFEKEPKNRRLTPRELEDEKIVAAIFKRPLRTFIRDPPTYPWLPPEPIVNFKLNYVE
nr:MAG: hypothetical protein [Betatorquevirus sp.]